VNRNRFQVWDSEFKLTQKLKELLSRVRWLRGWHVDSSADLDVWDLEAFIPLPTGVTAVLYIACKTNFQPGQFSSIAHKPCRTGRFKNIGRVLAMPFVSPRMTELCRENGWGWFDLAGNCSLDVPGFLSIQHSGAAPVRLPRNAANLGTPESGRVVRALLAPENAGRRWTQREVTSDFSAIDPPISAPSLALVNKVVQHLRDQAFIETAPDRGFRVRDYEGLLHAWRQAYRFERHRRIGYISPLHGPALTEKLMTFAAVPKGPLAYAAFSAVDPPAEHVGWSQTWLYADRTLEDKLRSALDATEVDSGENLIILIPGDAGVFYRLDRGADRLSRTNPVQTYVDLLHAGGRGAEETAQAILLQCLRPAWGAAPP
jgi:hypothetical protein